ncbi:MAG: flagellar export chaperone FliS [Oscillospiraceae bacterium]|nr:flagellar export chaperone FliS [Oscillospiraceae bacterium]
MVNPYSAYKKQSVQTMTPVEVIIKMYSEIERQFAIAVCAIEELKDIRKANDALIKAQELLGALRGSLDMSVPISKELNSFYVFFQNEAVKANIRKDATEIKKIIPLIADLRDAFTQISQMTKEEIEAQANSNKKK